MSEIAELPASQRHRVPQRLLGEIDAHCYMVQRGKPAALLPVGHRYSEQVMEHIRQVYGLPLLIEPLSDEWAEIWIYRHGHIAEVIRAQPRVPQTVVDHWTLGKLLGYDESSIAAFLAAAGAGDRDPEGV